MNQELELNNQTEGPTDRVSARRRLIRGAFAAPALLTVHAAGATAASSLGMCLVKRNASPTTGVLQTAANADNLFRYQLWAWVKIANATTQYPVGSIRTPDGYWISGADLVPFVRASQTPFLASTQWGKFDTTTNLMTTTILTGTSPPCSATTPSNWAFQRVASYVSLRVNSTGKIVGAGADTPGSAVGTSCWNSFAMGSGA